MKRYIRSNDTTNLPQLNYDSELDMFTIDFDQQPPLGSLDHYLYNSKLRRLGNKQGVEYGVVGNRRSRGLANNANSGYIGYKIESGVVYITRFSPQNLETASSWVREAMRNSDYHWIPVGRV